MERQDMRKSWTGDGMAHDQEFLVGRGFADYEMVEGKIRVGSRIILKRHATNRYDRNAITCWYPHPELGEVRVGYLDRHTASRLAPHMDKGVPLEAVVEYFQADIAVRIRRKRRR